MKKSVLVGVFLIVLVISLSCVSAMGFGEWVKKILQPPQFSENAVGDCGQTMIMEDGVCIPIGDDVVDGEGEDGEEDETGTGGEDEIGGDSDFVYSGGVVTVTCRLTSAKENEHGLLTGEVAHIKVSRRLPNDDYWEYVEMSDSYIGDLSLPAPELGDCQRTCDIRDYYYPNPDYDGSEDKPVCIRVCSDVDKDGDGFNECTDGDPDDNPLDLPHASCWPEDDKTTLLCEITYKAAINSNLNYGSCDRLVGNGCIMRYQTECLDDPRCDPNKFKTEVCQPDVITKEYKCSYRRKVILTETCGGSEKTLENYELIKDQIDCSKEEFKECAKCVVPKGAEVPETSDCYNAQLIPFDKTQSFEDVKLELGEYNFERNLTLGESFLESFADGYDNKLTYYVQEGYDDNEINKMIFEQLRKSSLFEIHSSENPSRFIRLFSVNTHPFMYESLSDVEDRKSEYVIGVEVIISFSDAIEVTQKTGEVVGDIAENVGEAVGDITDFFTSD